MNKSQLEVILLRHLRDAAFIDHAGLMRFHALLDGTLRNCTARNIQSTKRWILEHCSDRVRLQALLEYFQGLSEEFSTRLYIIYLLSDIVNHVIYNERNLGVRDSIQSALLPLLKSAYHSRNSDSLEIERILSIWDGKKYFERTVIETWRRELETEEKKEFVKPEYHGKWGGQYWEQPAGCMIPAITSNYNPIPPHIPVVRLPPTTSKGVQTALEEFYSTSNVWKFSEEEVAEREFDYEGWSKKFVRERQEKVKGKGVEGMRMGFGGPWSNRPIGQN
ncbi:hypothetical protein NEOLI_004520 [Neolecta irregularis DAH-3]|uniref:CID domain-containing protein n=1 Tax=Neolecta irregularis (strain DAH-3) TaxID=1198029 RepID=A0A1U7LHM5_NEOID|nr:hypothetical protein NEOLI_004520 [Neolecta irregularis DAH-3]|eukprot:OLL22160.1 hypothetical protein NEOLI_004520 [Neolecta irregularis DAH-3]